jgi:agmatine/peptidylarginine deiminase
LIDTYGNMYISKVIYRWNDNVTPAELDKKMKDYWGVKNIYSFEYSGYPNDPLDGTGHIDMFMKLLNDDTVVVTVGDVEPFKQVGEKVVEFFTNRIAPNGKKYTVLTVPGYWVNNKVWYTWSNSLIFNNVLLLPTYKDYPTQNQLAKEIHENAGYRVVEINADKAIVLAGAVHCITQSIPRMVQ